MGFPDATTVCYKIWLRAKTCLLDTGQQGLRWSALATVLHCAALRRATAPFETTEGRMQEHSEPWKNHGAPVTKTPSSLVRGRFSAGASPRSIAARRSISSSSAEGACTRARRHRHTKDTGNPCNHLLPDMRNRGAGTEHGHTGAARLPLLPGSGSLLFHQIGAPLSHDAHEMQPVTTLGAIFPDRRRSGTRQTEVVPKLVEPLLIAAIEQRNSYPGFFHLAIRFPSTTFSRMQKSRSSREISFFLWKSS